MNIRKISAVLLSLLMVAACFGGCAPAAEQEPVPAQEETAQTPAPVAEPTAEPQSPKYVPGTYVGHGTGHAGEMAVEVVCTADAIESVKVLETKDTFYICPVAEDTMAERIVAAQSLAVDTTTGATGSSRGILAAVEDALTQANADIAALKQPVETAASTEETQCDVLVVGAGLAGLSAANRLLDQGKDVLLIETMAYTGGAAKFSGGSIRIADNEDYAERAYQYLSTEMYYGTDPVNEKYPDMDRVREACYRSIDVYNWQTKVGIVMEDSTADTDGTFTRKPLIPEQYLSMKLSRRGNFLTEQYEAAYLNNGGRLLLNTKATELLMDKGAVVGAVADTLTGSVTIKAKAVILATGSIGSDKELMAQYLPQWKDDITELPVGTDGSGIRMALAAGAVMTEDQYCNGGATHAYPMDAFTTLNGPYKSRQDISAKSMFVSVDGQRKANESNDRYLRDYTSTDGPNQLVSISDKATLEELGHLEKYEAEVEKNGTKGPYYKADTIEDLAAQMGMDPAVLAATVDRYNTFCETGIDEDYGKPSANLLAIDEGPFYAVKTTMCCFDFIGGVETDGNGAIVDANGAEIPGLYGAGFISSRSYNGTGSAHSYCLIICVSTGFICADSAIAYMG